MASLRSFSSYRCGGLPGPWTGPGARWAPTPEVGCVAIPRTSRAADALDRGHFGVAARRATGACSRAHGAGGRISPASLSGACTCPAVPPSNSPQYAAGCGVGESALVCRLLDDLRDPAGANGAAALADGEAQALLHGDRLDQVDRHLGVVAGHDHLGALGQRDDAGHVRGAEVELRTVVLKNGVCRPPSSLDRM